MVFGTHSLEFTGAGFAQLVRPYASADAVRVPWVLRCAPAADHQARRDDDLGALARDAQQGFPCSAPVDASDAPPARGCWPSR
jgi:hypothetical protein